MNRRSFITKAIGHSETPLEKAFSPRPLNVTAGLEPYNAPLDKNAALHLLRRTGFQPILADVKYAIGKTAPAIVSELLLEGKKESEIGNPPPPTWVNEIPVIPITLEELQIQNNKHVELMTWWYDRMALAPLAYSLREKMTFFWHNHFTSSREKVQLPHLMYFQNDKFRRNPIDGTKADDPAKPAPTAAFGNIKQLTRSMVSDTAMLIYLDNYVNQKGLPNENFARELMELFTLGIGNYTEQDVMEAARTVTGWTIVYNPNTREISPASSFVPFYADSKSKTIFGKTSNFNTDSLIDILFEQEACAKFFARKLYRFFVYEIPDEKIVDQLAAQLKANNYEVQPVLKTLLTSAHFFDQEFHGAQIKSPLDYMAGMARQFNTRPLPSNYGIIFSQVLNLDIFNPPNVAGWKGYREWITTTTFAYRQRLSEILVNDIDFSGMKTNQHFDILGMVNRFDSKDDPVQLVADLVEYMLPAGITAKQQDFLLNTLLQGTPAYEWKITNPLSEARLRLFFRAIMRLPEYQLM